MNFTFLHCTTFFLNPNRRAFNLCANLLRLFLIVIFSGLIRRRCFHWPEVANTNQIQKGKKGGNQGPSWLGCAWGRHRPSRRAWEHFRAHGACPLPHPQPLDQSGWVTCAEAPSLRPPHCGATSLLGVGQQLSAGRDWCWEPVPGRCGKAAGGRPVCRRGSPMHGPLTQ